VDLTSMPLFVRAGALLPIGPVKQYSDEAIEGPLTVQVYPGADAAFTVYEDDGRSFDYRRGDWMGLDMRWEDRQRRLRFELAKGSRMRAPDRRQIHVRTAGSQEVREIFFTGSPLELQL
jgi:alpha-glucosidase (family GH31 glycosyl hydrolase)